MSARTTAAQKVGGRLISAVAAIALLLLATEGICRWLKLPAARGPLAWKASWAPLNSWGFRGPEPDPGAATRLLLLGDSQVEAVSIHDHHGAPGPQLERHLRGRGVDARVVSMAAAGWGTDQQLLALQHYFARLRPHAVLLFYTFENDIIDNLFVRGPGGPKPTFRLDSVGRLVPPDAALWLPPGATPRYGLRALLRRALGPAPPGDPQWDRTMPGPTPATRGAGVQLDLFLRGLYGFATPVELADLEQGRVSWALFRDPMPPRIRHGFALQRALLARMRDYCASRRVPLYIFKQRDPLLQQRLEGRTLILEGHALRFSPAAAERRLQELMSALRIPFLDVPLDHGKHTLLPQDPHLSRAGYTLLTRRVGDWLLSYGDFKAIITKVH